MRLLKLLDRIYRRTFLIRVKQWIGSTVWIQERTTEAKDSAWCVHLSIEHLLSRQWPKQIQQASDALCNDIIL
uniref:Secreted protein n=1 Tax=Globodera pallida TaxID=36090 RepID=A0A183BKA6_GLOPA